MQVQIRPWNLSDSDFVMDGSQPLDPRKTIFVGGVPRPLRAGKLLKGMGCLFFFFAAQQHHKNEVGFVASAGTGDRTWTL